MKAKLLAPILAIILCSAVVFAADNEPRILPHNPLWGLKLAFEKVTEIFSEKKKAEHAQERLRELQAELVRGDSEAAEKVLAKVKKAQSANLLKAEDTEKVQKQFDDKFTIDLPKLQEAINKNSDATEALKSYTGTIALFVKYPEMESEEAIRIIKIVVGDDGKVTSIEKTDSKGTYDFYFNLSHGQLYAYSQQIIEGKGNNLLTLLKVASKVGGTRGEPITQKSKDSGRGYNVNV